MRLLLVQAEIIRLEIVGLSLMGPSMLAIQRGRGRRTGRHKAYSGGDQRDAEPACRRDLLVKADARDYRHQHIAEGGGGQNVGEVGPGKRGHIRREERQQEKDPNGDKGIEDGKKQAWNVVQRRSAKVFHAAGQQGIAERAEDSDAGEDEIFAKGHWNLACEE